MKTMFSRAAILVAAMFIGTTTASAQTFSVSADCGDKWLPGDLVPYGVRIDENIGVDHTLQVVFSVTPPGMNPIVLVDKTITLPANAAKEGLRELKLPATAPIGDYQMTMSADDGNETIVDTCSFKVE